MTKVVERIRQEEDLLNFIETPAADSGQRTFLTCHI